MIRAIERSTNGLVFKEDIENYLIDHYDLLYVRWFKLLQHRKALNALIEMKLRVAALERDLRSPDHCTERVVYERGGGRNNALCRSERIF